MCKMIGQVRSFFSGVRSWNRVVPVVLGALVVVGLSADPSYALSTGLIDFDSLAKQIQPLLTEAVQAAAGVGAVVLAAAVCWKFFKKFIRG